MITGHISKLERKDATITLDGPDGDELHFNPTHKSVCYGEVFVIGDRVSVRMSRNNLRVDSVVKLPPGY